jgi:MraZ protein
LKESGLIFHITRGPNDCLFVYPREVFKNMVTRLNAHFGSRGTSDDEERRYFLETMGDAHPVRCDQQGRITVPLEHLEYAKISGEVLIIGAADHLEFWNPKVYEEFIGVSQFSSKDRVNRFGWVEKEKDGQGH